ncbi:uncharacterized protein LOC119442090 [Dermacentor silvarum]|uniref:uncharacterized protein LOC119442090 n=1 Tax=Dermacentor silvarum TaxID=543639 RepID=UPI00189C1BE4|nr:uncharacterized protein LOC119442090 [Dermacentor silvarum]
MSARTARGLDNIPAGILKTLGARSREQLAEIFTGILKGDPVPEDWLRGRVTLIPKRGGDAGLLRDYRPVTVTSVVYRVFAQVLKTWMSAWAEANNHLTELQNGFRKDRRLEDNVFALTQCVEIARKEARTLVCCFLDVSKAYDSVPHAELLQCLSDMEMPLAWTSVLQRLYNNNRVVTTMCGVRSSEVAVTRGLKQGCPLSPLLYMLYVSRVERQLLKLGLGFTLGYVDGGMKGCWVLPGLVFADDIVLMAGSATDLQAQMNSCADKMAALGLSFNAKKSAVLHFSGPAEVDRSFTLPGGEAVEQATEYRYLGVNLCTQPDYTATHEDHLRTASRRAGSVLRRRGLWGFNRYVMVRELWKAVHVPTLTFTNAIICMSSPTREWLERGQRVVGRLGTGCHGNVANEAIQGDLGWSSFEAREAKSKISYDGRLRAMGKHRWARRVFDYVTVNGVRTRWMKRLQQLRKKFGFFCCPTQAENAQVSAKATLQLYRTCKTDIHREDFYDNSIGSSLLFEARAGALRTLEYRHHFDPTIASTICRACGEEDESIEHIVLRCKRLPTLPPEDATFSRTLGFRSADDATSGNGDEVLLAAVMVTKRRLSEWWTLVRR